MDEIKILAIFCLLITTGLGTVNVVEPVNQSLEPNMVLNLTENPVQSGYNLDVFIEKNNWVNVTSPDLPVSIRERDGQIRIQITMPDRSGINESELVFEDADGETQTNTIIYKAQEAGLKAFMSYPLHEEIRSEDEPIEIGKVAPGQKIVLLFERRMDGGPFRWERAEVVEEESEYYMVPLHKNIEEILPSETVEEKELDIGATYLALELRAPKQLGAFNFDIKLNSDWSNPAVRTLQVDVNEDVYNISLPETTYVKAGEPGQIRGQIASDSIAVETFSFTPLTLPSEWVAGEDRYKTFGFDVRSKETREFTLPININQEGLYESSYRVVDSSGMYVGAYSTDIRVKPSLRSKLRGFREGHSLTLPLLQPFYSLLSLFA